MFAHRFPRARTFGLFLLAAACTRSGMTTTRGMHPAWYSPDHSMGSLLLFWCRLSIWPLNILL